MPSSSHFFVDEGNKPIKPFQKSLLVNFSISTDKSSAGWDLTATNTVTQSEKPDYTIPVVEFDLTETSADDMAISGTH